MEIRPFRTDLPIRFRFLSTFYPEGDNVSCYLLWFNSMNHGEISRCRVALVEREVESESGDLEKVWETTFRGVDQRKLGEYHIVLILNENQPNQKQLVVSDAFKLVLKYDYGYDEDTLRVTITIKAGEQPVPVCPAPEVSLPTGSIYSESRQVTAETSLQDATIKYTTDGTNPISSETALVYSEPIVVSSMGTTTLKFAVVKPEYVSSSVVTRQVQCRQIQNVLLSADGGDYSSTRTITMSCETQGVDIHYTLDGSTPTVDSPVYSDSDKPVISTTKTVKAIAMKAGWTDSGMSTKEFVVGLGGVYYGYAGSTITAEGVESLDGFKAQLDPKGQYQSTTDTNAWLWVCIDPTQIINYIMSGPFEVPMDAPITVGTYKCYRSALQHKAGTINFTVY